MMNAIELYTKHDLPWARQQACLKFRSLCQKWSRARRGQNGFKRVVVNRGCYVGINSSQASTHVVARAIHKESNTDLWWQMQLQYIT